MICKKMLLLSISLQKPKKKMNDLEGNNRDADIRRSNNKRRDNRTTWEREDIVVK